MQKSVKGAVPAAQQILNKYGFINLMEYKNKYLFNHLDLWSSTHLAQDRRFSSAWQRFLPCQRGEGMCLHPSFRNEVPCSISHQEFRDTPLEHEHPSQPFPLDSSSVLVPNWALAAASPPRTSTRDFPWLLHSQVQSRGNSWI